MKTAMQWLKEQYIERGETIPLGVFKEALEKEKEQIIEAHKRGSMFNGWALKHEHEQYYNQTYNQNK